jgi:signal transduction histidine kinase
VTLEQNGGNTPGSADPDETVRPSSTLCIVSVAVSLLGTPVRLAGTPVADVFRQPSVVPAPSLTPAILVIVADDPTAPYVGPLVSGLQEATSGGHATVLYLEFFDQVRFGDPTHAAEFSEWLQRKYRDRRVDVIVTVSQSSLELLTDPQRRPLPGVPIVYGILGDLTIDISRSLPDATGVIIENPLPAALLVMKQLLPDTRRIAFTSGAAPEERARGNWYSAQIAKSGFELLDLSALPMDDLLARLAHLPPGTAVLHSVIQVDGAGRIFAGQEACELISAAASRPMFGISRAQLGCGIVGGPLVDYSLFGRALGEQAIKRLEGEPVSTVRLPLAQTAPPVFDARQLARWQIAEARLPAGSTVLFRAGSLWRDYRGTVIAAIAVIATQTLLIAGVLIEQRRRKRVQAALQESYQETRELAGRLISTREAERARIARELHDNLSQKLALLALGIDRLGLAVDRDRDAAARVRALSARAGSIAEEVHTLSHQLHPSRLETLGLVAAMQSLCGETSILSELEVDFAHTSVPAAIPPETALCLFRIAQEALHNVIRHSGALRAAVYLYRSDDGLNLEVSDSGRGFAPGGAASHGLGLLSMRERLSLLGGRLEIATAEGSGTRITARVPIPSPPRDTATTQFSVETRDL